MKKHIPKKLGLNRETLHRLDGAALRRAAGRRAEAEGTLTVEPPCGPSDACPPPDTGCGSTLSCTL